MMASLLGPLVIDTTKMSEIYWEPYSISSCNTLESSQHLHDRLLYALKTFMDHPT